MTREEALRQIAEIDKKLNQEYDKNRAPRGSVAFKKFPLGAWIFVAVILACYMFGGMINRSLHQDYGIYVFYAAVFFGLFALYHTVRWVMTRGGKTNKQYLKETEQLRMLQAQRQELEKLVAAK